MPPDPSPTCEQATDPEKSDGDVWLRLQTSHDVPLPAEAAAAYLDITLSHLYRLISRREVGHYKPGGKRVYFLKRDLDAYALRHRVASDEELEREAATRAANASWRVS